MELRMRIREIAQSRVRYGYSKIRVLLNREGWDVGKHLVVAFQIIWHTSVLIIWRTDCGSGGKRCGDGTSQGNKKLRALPRITGITPGMILCQII